MYLFQIGRFYLRRKMTEREDGAGSCCNHLVGCAFGKEPRSRSSVRAKHNPVRMDLGCSAQDLLCQIAGRHHGMYGRGWICCVWDERLQSAPGPSDGPFRIHARIRILIEHMQKGQMGLVCLRYLKCEVKPLPIVADEGDRMENISWHYLLDRAFGRGADYKNGDRHFGYQIMSDGTQSELP